MESFVIFPRVTAECPKCNGQNASMKREIYTHPSLPAKVETYTCKRCKNVWANYTKREG